MSVPIARLSSILCAAGALPDPRDLGQIIEEVYEEDAGETLEAEEDFDAIEVISSSQ